MKFKNNKNSTWLYFINYILENKFLFGVLLFYALLMLSIIDWGIPNQSHPFTYNMDEWHQLQAVRTTFTYLSPNVPGSAHGTMFQFILSGIYLIPFYILGIINPFMITSSTNALVLQHRLFEVLRLNTLIFGLLSIFFIAKIAKEYLKINKNIVVILFVVTPLWISLSNYFKYDIALVFWIILSLFYLLRFGSKPTLKNYLFAGIFCSLSVATKVSALPIFLAYLISYFWFNKKNKWKLNELFLGILVFFVIFIFLGVPDLLLDKGDWREFLYSNLISGSSGYESVLTGFNTWWQYILFKILPIDFGYGFSYIYVLGILYWTVLFLRNFLNKKLFLFKNEFFLLSCFLLFVLSLVPLKLGASGNRLLVLLPFFSLLSGSFLHKIKGVIVNNKVIAGGLLTIIFITQFYQSIITVYVKWLPDVRQTSSQWIKKNIKQNTLIGIENIPIYQLLPDIVVKDFYSEERIPKYHTNFQYQIIDGLSKTLPQVVIITNKELEYYFFKTSSKKQLIERLLKDGYREIIEFNSPSILHSLNGNYLDFFISGLAQIPTISVYAKLNN